MDKKWLEKYPRMTETLLEYGWFVAPFILGHHFDRLEDVCQELANNPPSDDKSKKACELKINQVLSEIAFHPNWRAFFVYRSKELPHIKEYAHLYEKAILNYYKKDYLSTVLVIIPAIEGVLLSFYGWTFGLTRKPSFRELTEKINATVSPSKYPNLVDAFNMYKAALVKFLDIWIFERTNKADFSLSYLNRHYILHGMGSENYYRPLDAHRLILLFDLIIEYLSLLSDNHYSFIPHDKPALNFRRAYYTQLINGDLTSSVIHQFESEFLKENPNFHEAENEPTWTNPQIKSIWQVLDLFSIMESKNIKNKQKED